VLRVCDLCYPHAPAATVRGLARGVCLRWLLHTRAFMRWGLAAAFLGMPRVRAPALAALADAPFFMPGYAVGRRAGDERHRVGAALEHVLS